MSWTRQVSPSRQRMLSMAVSRVGESVPARGLLINSRWRVIPSKNPGVRERVRLTLAAPVQCRRTGALGDGFSWALVDE